MSLEKGGTRQWPETMGYTRCCPLLMLFCGQKYAEGYVLREGGCSTFVRPLPSTGVGCCLERIVYRQIYYFSRESNFISWGDERAENSQKLGVRLWAKSIQRL